KRINNKINTIRRLENGCNEFGITSGNRMNKVIETNDDSALLVFDMYLDDVREKLVVFDPLIKKLKLFSESLRSLLDLKEVKINLSQNPWDSVLEVRNRLGVNIPLEALSSGEQHLIVLLGRLLFNTENPDALVMMDEPEISFHPSWQEDFSEILFKIQNNLREGKNGKRQFIIATHSPAFIGNRWDKTVELAKMVKDR
ncbi:MAG: ATP-binding protein, partial [Fibrobacter sp.]|nr:ATP-binding protein [Fibrobacter sp.]